MVDCSRTGKSLALSAVILLLAVPAVLQAHDKIPDDLRTTTAVRTTAAIDIDGRLDEPAWESIPVASGFRQIEPDDGVPSTQKTEVRFLYDDAAVYVGFTCYDSEPDKIIGQITRRDRYTESDMVSVRFDSHHDHQTAYYFSVNAGGVQRDILLYNNTWSDSDWDAVWEANVQRTSFGWTAEFRIPYSALRFTEAEEYTWGLDMTRYIPRNDETVRWQWVSNEEQGGVSRYGHLEGIKGISPPRRLEVKPYAVSYGIDEPSSAGNLDGRDYISDMGADVSYGLSSAFTLDVAINPDFGQVESDEAVLNLGTYETFFPEKRPFFLEGREIYSTQFYNQFYSRRIGRTPRNDPDDVDYYTDYPNNTTILSAAKLSGKTTSGTSIGILNATTERESARYRGGDGFDHSAVVEPLANYTVARIKQDFGGNSYVGGMFTSVLQEETDNAYTGSVDLKMNMLDDMFQLAAAAIGTHNGPDQNGGSASASLNKVGGKVLRGNIFIDYYDNEVDYNRLGYLNRNGYWGISTWQQLYSNKTVGPVRYANVNFNGWYNELLGGRRFWNGGNVNTNMQFTNNWWFWGGVGFGNQEADDRETRGDGLWLKPSRTNYWVGGRTNSSAPIDLELSTSGSTERAGNSRWYNVWVNMRPMSRLEVSVGTRLGDGNRELYWVGEHEPSGDPAFGHLDQNIVDINTRGLYSFTRNLTIQWYTQLYFSAGEYADDYRRLIHEADVSTVIPSDQIDFSRADFNYKAFNVNLVLRWEYRPGSTIYAVWTQARNGYHEDFGDFRFSRDFDDLFEAPHTNTFLVKVDYWWTI